MGLGSQGVYEALKKLFVTDKDGHIIIDNASIAVTTDGLKASDLSIEATSKHLGVDVQNHPTTYPDTITEPRNISQIGGTAQTGADWTPLLQKLDAALSTLARLQPWYQTNFAAKISNYSAADVAPHADTTRWTYTVPASRLAIVTHLLMQFYRKTAATTVNTTTIYVIGPSNLILSLIQSYDNNVGSQSHNIIGQSMILTAGQSLAAHTYDQSTGGTHDFTVSMTAMEFNT